MFAKGRSITLVVAVAAALAACDDDDDPSGPSNQNVSGSVAANHGHTATVTSVQLMAGNAIQLNIQGTADHPHTVDLTANEVTQIGSGQRVSKQSSNDPSAAFGPHAHTVTFN